MAKKNELKKVMRETKDHLKDHKNLHKKIFGAYKMSAKKGQLLSEKSRKRLHSLLAEEERLVNGLLEKGKTEQRGLR